MAQVLNLNTLHSSTRPESNSRRNNGFVTRKPTPTPKSWTSLQQELKCDAKFTCLFSGRNGDREEQARKALESALGGKKSDFEKWNKEIEKREEALKREDFGGGGGGRGGWWSDWGRHFGWSNDPNFWANVQQTILAVLGIFALYLIVAKGEVMLAVVINPLLYALRGTRNGITLLWSRILGKASPGDPVNLARSSRKEIYVQASAKESVLKKWGRDD